MNMIIIELGKRIRTAREKAGYNQQDFANELGISTSHMSNIENGKVEIGIEIFVRVVKKLNVSADWLLQIDTPNVNAQYGNKIAALLEGMSPEDTKAIYEAAELMKTSLCQARKQTIL